MEQNRALGNIELRLSHRLPVPVMVRYAPYSAAGWASFPDDFEAASGTLTFQPGEVSRTVPLTIKGDTLDELDEGALIIFTEPTIATVGGFGVGGVTITDDD